MDLARHVIGDAIKAIYASTHGSIPERNDPRKMLALMQWWNLSQTTRRVMPCFHSLSDTAAYIGQIKQHCHICHCKRTRAFSKKGPICKCTPAEVFAFPPRNVELDMERLRTILSSHETLCCGERPFRDELILLEKASDPAWFMAMNAKLYQYLGRSFIDNGRNRSDEWDWRWVDNAVSYMSVPFSLTLLTKGCGRRSVVSRFQALDVANEGKESKGAGDSYTFYKLVPAHDDVKPADRRLKPHIRSTTITIPSSPEPEPLHQIDSNKDAPRRRPRNAPTKSAP